MGQSLAPLASSPGRCARDSMQMMPLQPREADPVPGAGQVWRRHLPGNTPPSGLPCVVFPEPSFTPPSRKTSRLPQPLARLLLPPAFAPENQSAREAGGWLPITQREQIGLDPKFPAGCPALRGRSVWAAPPPPASMPPAATSLFVLCPPWPHGGGGLSLTGRQ